MSAASLVTSVPVMPIATPMSAAFSAGASLTPSPVIATMLPSRLQRVDDAQLVLGRDAGVDRDVAHRAPRSASSSSALELGAGERRGDPSAAMPRSPAMRAAVRGWSPVIMITRTPAPCGLGDRRARLGPRRVDDADQPEVDELALERLVRRPGGSPSGSGR